LITEVIFDLIVFWGLFGWMDALIIAKWFNHINIDDVSDAPDIDAIRLYCLQKQPTTAISSLVFWLGLILLAITRTYTTEIICPRFCGPQRKPG
jgi:hypothetical protein